MRIGRVAAERVNDIATVDGKQFLDTVYEKSSRTFGFKGGFVVPTPRNTCTKSEIIQIQTGWFAPGRSQRSLSVSLSLCLSLSVSLSLIMVSCEQVYVNGVHIPIPDDLVKLGKAANMNAGGTRIGGRVHGCLELSSPPGISLLSSGKEKLDERHPRFEKCKEWLETRLDYYFKVRKASLLCPLILKKTNRTFATTGSGQTQEKLRGKRTGVSAGALFRRPPGAHSQIEQR